LTKSITFVLQLREEHAALAKAQMCFIEIKSPTVFASPPIMTTELSTLFEYEANLRAKAAKKSVVVTPQLPQMRAL
jgi:hypothetical protein